MSNSRQLLVFLQQLTRLHLRHILHFTFCVPVLSVDCVFAAYAVERNIALNEHTQNVCDIVFRFKHIRLLSLPTLVIVKAWVVCLAPSVSV